MNPLWTPPWPSIKPSLYNAVVDLRYGDGCEAKLIAVIMGIAFASIIFGGPSAEEAAAGVRHAMIEQGKLFGAHLPLAAFEERGESRVLGAHAGSGHCTRTARLAGLGVYMDQAAPAAAFCSRLSFGYT